VKAYTLVHFCAHLQPVNYPVRKIQKLYCSGLFQYAEEASVFTVVITCTQAYAGCFYLARRRLHLTSSIVNVLLVNRKEFCFTKKKIILS